MPTRPPPRGSLLGVVVPTEPFRSQKGSSHSVGRTGHTANVQQTSVFVSTTRRSVQLAEICHQCFQITLLQIYCRHTAIAHLSVGRAEKRNQLRVCIFLANAR